MQYNRSLIALQLSSIVLISPDRDYLKPLSYLEDLRHKLDQDTYLTTHQRFWTKKT